MSYSEKDFSQLHKIIIKLRHLTLRWEASIVESSSSIGRSASTELGPDVEGGGNVATEEAPGGEATFFEEGDA